MVDDLLNKLKKMSEGNELVNVKQVTQSYQPSTNFQTQDDSTSLRSIPYNMNTDNNNNIFKQAQRENAVKHLGHGKR